jgi:sulfur carrier protein
MHVFVNGEPRDVGDAKSVRDVVVQLGLTEGPVAVELNREIVPRAEHASQRVQEGDVLEIVHFVGGG